MSIESFYANIKIENFNVECLDSIMKEYTAFSKAFSYSRCDDDKELSIKATLISFLPACELLFRLLELINIKSRVIEIETRKERHAFDFNGFLDFFSWFYGCWRERLEKFNKEWGAFIVRSPDYYKARRHLRKKYMITY